MKKETFYKWLLLILILVNVGTLIYYSFGRPPRPPKPGDLSEQLQLTGDAANQVNRLEKAHHPQKQRLMRKSRELHEKLFEEIGNHTSDTDSLLHQIDLNQAEIEAMTFAFFDSVSHYCNDAQKKELRTTIQGVYRHLMPPGKPPK